MECWQCSQPLNIHVMTTYNLYIYQTATKTYVSYVPQPNLSDAFETVLSTTMFKDWVKPALFASAYINEGYSFKAIFEESILKQSGWKWLEYFKYRATAKEKKELLSEYVFLKNNLYTA